MAVNRRDFTRLAAAALGGALAGAKLAAAEDKKEADKPQKKDVNKPLLLQEPHVCRGLNSCKSKGKGGKNDCAGQGACHTAKEHTCGGDNDCAGLGGCGDKPGENACKGKGDCHVPLGDKAWAKARKSYEAAMKKADKKFGDAPKKSEK
jgi:hypothetical protein